MQNGFVENISLPNFPLWDSLKEKKKVVSFDLEITSRCNNNCRHCYINLPAQDKKAKEKEIPLSFIETIADQARDLGALWCLITGGEPLLREDFTEIYLSLKRKGLLVSVFTNATLINSRHIELFKKYPPRDIEVTVYGVTRETYEQVSRVPGSFERFRRGLDLLLEAGIKVRFKAMALRSNAHELREISDFCRERTKDYFRFDPILHLRYDRDPLRNEEIISERLAPRKIVEIEQADQQRFDGLKSGCDSLILPECEDKVCNHLFHCGSGNHSFAVSCEGFYRPCPSLWHPGCLFDLKQGSLDSAHNNFTPQVRQLRSDNQEFLEKCRRCTIINLCIWCPAHAYLETGFLDAHVKYFCEVANARKEMLGK